MSNFPSISDLLGLCKLKVVALILLTAVVGMLLSVPYIPDIALMIMQQLGLAWLPLLLLFSIM